MLRILIKPVVTFPAFSNPFTVVDLCERAMIAAGFSQVALDRFEAEINRTNTERDVIEVCERYCELLEK